MIYRTTKPSGQRQPDSSALLWLDPWFQLGFGLTSTLRTLLRTLFPMIEGINIVSKTPLPLPKTERNFIFSRSTTYDWDTTECAHIEHIFLHDVPDSLSDGLPVEKFTAVRSLTSRTGYIPAIPQTHPKEFLINAFSTLTHLTSPPLFQLPTNLFPAVTHFHMLDADHFLPVNAFSRVVPARIDHPTTVTWLVQTFPHLQVLLGAILPRKYEAMRQRMSYPNDGGFERMLKLVLRRGEQLRVIGIWGYREGEPNDHFMFKKERIEAMLKGTDKRVARKVVVLPRKGLTLKGWLDEREGKVESIWDIVERTREGQTKLYGDIETDEGAVTNTDEYKDHDLQELKPEYTDGWRRYLRSLNDVHQTFVEEHEADPFERHAHQYLRPNQGAYPSRGRQCGAVRDSHGNFSVSLEARIEGFADGLGRRWSMDKVDFREVERMVWEPQQWEMKSSRGINDGQPGYENENGDSMDADGESETESSMAIMTKILGIGWEEKKLK